jgi:predicted nuclease of predicted toxin-antitoxin system
MRGFLFDENLPRRLTFTLRFGNLRRRDFHQLLAKVWPQIEGLLPAHKLICVYHDRIESIGD